jgi:hypothetical protein
VRRNRNPGGHQALATIARATEGDPARVTMVTAAACHFCEDARGALDQLARQYPLAVTEAPADSPDGQTLLRAHGSGMFPLGRALRAACLPIPPMGSDLGPGTLGLEGPAPKGQPRAQCGKQPGSDGIPGARQGRTGNECNNPQDAHRARR